MYDLYKPLRNRLRQYEAESGLLAIYSFMQFLYFGQPLPRQLSVPALNWRTPFEVGLFEWEFDTLAREILANCPMNGGKKFDSWKDLADCVNLIRHIENEAWGRQPDSEKKILYEVLRIAHRQFPWQDKVGTPDLVRYLKIYRHPDLSDLLFKEFGLYPDQVFTVGLAIAGHFFRNRALVGPITSSLPGIDPEAAIKLTTHMTKTLEQHRSEIESFQSYDINWAYVPNHLRRCPLVQLSQNLVVCPITPFLLNWLTDSIYFDLVSHGGTFNRAFGEAFQNYVGEALKAANHDEAYKVIPEARYGTRKQPKDSIDWIISDADAALFIECKASRMKLKGKIDLTTVESMEQEIKRLAVFVVQAYVTLNDALHGLYKHWEVRDRVVYPIVVTLENWRALRIPSEKIIEAEVKAMFTEKQLDAQLLEDHPYQICSVEELEDVVQMMGKIGIRQFMKLRKEHGGAKSTLHGLLTSFPDTELEKDVKELFPNELERLENSFES